MEGDAFHLAADFTSIHEQNEICKILRKSDKNSSPFLLDEFSFSFVFGSLSTIHQLQDSHHLRRIQ